jgi:hypothetical protein
MKFEYLEDPGARPDRVLLLHGPTADDVDALRGAAAGLAGGMLQQVRLDQVAPGEADPSLLGEVGETDAGVEPIAGEASAFRCVLNPEGWERVRELLEPFAEPREGTFQYLTEAGEIEWIVSTYRGW